MMSHKMTSPETTIEVTLPDGNVIGETTKTFVELTTPFGVLREPAGGAVEWVGRELQRLRALIKQVELAQGGTNCPWCYNTWTPHTEECPAFTPEGEVK